ncbi:hypothetical protein [Streptomyces sp. NPDC126499]|uniref:hypothetical protein n=1 Tax=Streptomyces sp. NPDC126499 TaxID=3155314 RepID=UPI0033289968
MSASEQDKPETGAGTGTEAGARAVTGSGAVEPGETAAATEAGTKTAAGTVTEAGTESAAGTEAATEAEAGDGTEAAPEPGTEADELAERTGLTPRQARLLRVVVGAVLLVVMGVVLVVRLAAHTSVLVVGVYGLAMILCGVVIELSRNGRTRLATWLLAGGLLTALALDWLVLP